MDPPELGMWLPGAGRLGQHRQIPQPSSRQGLPDQEGSEGGGLPDPRPHGALAEEHSSPRLRHPLPFDTASVDCIYSSHTLEHLYLSEAQALLVDARRVLRPGGILRLAFPNGELWARDLIAGKADSAATPGHRFNEILNSHPMTPPTRKQKLLKPFASRPHMWQPTSDLVKYLLGEAGFASVEQRNFREGLLPHLEAVEHRQESLFIEAR